MSNPAAPAPHSARDPVPPAERIGSVDTLRGLVITLMIFVNDVAGVAGAPGWLQHAGIDDDAMTLPDIVFPAFLFIAGVSIPLAFERALSHGGSRAQLIRKIFGRTAALLVMGVLMVNAETHNPWFRGAWALLAYAAMLLAFVVIPTRPPQTRARWRLASIAGWIGILALALSYRGQTATGESLWQPLVFGPLLDGSDAVWLRHSWWGILGLIAWAYLTASLLYLWLGHRREWLLGMVGILVMIYVAGQAGFDARLESRPWLEWAMPLIASGQAVVGWIDSHVSVGESLGSLAAIAVAGTGLGSILTRRSEISTPRDRLRWALTFAAGLAVAAVLFDPLYGLNKIRATPAWSLLCAALTAAAWAALYWWMDIRGHRNWSRIVAPAGANPLLAYLLHPLIFYLAAFAGVPLDFYRASHWPVAAGIAGSLLMAFFVVQLTGWIVRTGYRLKV